MSKQDGTTWLWNKSLPRWYRNGGVYASESTLYGIRREPDRLVRSKPTIQSICGPLMGASSQGKDGSYYATFPSLVRRLAFYEEGLNLVALFGEREDILTLAVYRRQVHPRRAISLDERFLDLADTFSLTCKEWEMLAVRMPVCSRVWVICQARSVARVLVPATVAVAEAA